jgi:hypothetical protein
VLWPFQEQKGEGRRKAAVRARAAAAASWPSGRRRPRLKRSGGEEAGRLKAKAQAAGPKTGDGPKLKKKFLSNFKLKLGIWLDFGNLHKEI